MEAILTSCIDSCHVGYIIKRLRFHHLDIISTSFGHKFEIVSTLLLVYTNCMKLTYHLHQIYINFMSRLHRIVQTSVLVELLLHIFKLSVARDFTVWCAYYSSTQPSYLHRSYKAARNVKCSSN